MIEHHGIESSGFDDPEIDDNVFIEFAAALDDVLPRYPAIDLREAAITELPNGQVSPEMWDWTPAPNGPRPYTVCITLATKAARDVRHMTYRVRRAVESDLLVPESEVRPVYSTIVRELGRALDVVGGFRARRRVQRVLPAEYLRSAGDRDDMRSVIDSYRRWRSDLSGYGFYGQRLHPGKALAEVFTDVQLHDTAASMPAQVLHHLLVETDAEGGEAAVRFGELSQRALRVMFTNALKSVIEGRDPSHDSGFGPDTEQALTSLAFARADAKDSLITKVRSVFDAELAMRPVLMPTYGEAARLVLTRMAHCSLLEWQAAHNDPSDIEVVRRYRDQRRTWLARLAELDSDHLDPGDFDSLISALHSTTTRPASEPEPPESLEPDSLAAIFDHDIVPAIFPATIPCDEPGALFLYRSSEYPLSALRVASKHSCAAVDPVLLAAYHPHTAISVSAGVRHDTLMWTVMAIGYAVEHRLDVVVQIAAEEPRLITDVMSLFACSDYRVTVRMDEHDSDVSP